jgi:hypothetical protein
MANRTDITRNHKGYGVNIRSNKPWQHNDVYSYDPLPITIPDRTMITYRVEEFDPLVINKATKTGETTQGNIALLSDNEGDLVDSGVHPSDLVVCVIDCGEF